MKFARLLVLVFAVYFTLGLKSGLAAPDEYDDSQSHPLRIAAYLLHPAGFLLEWMIFRPFHFLVSGAEPLEAFFGHTPHPPVIAEPQPIHNYGVPKKVPMKDTRTGEPQSATAAPAQQPLAEKVRVVEVPVEKTVIKEVPKIVETERLVLPDVDFRFGSAELTDVGKGKVYLAAQKLKEESALAFIIEGHTDRIGSDEYNYNLGRRRAQTVINELTSLGIDPTRMSAVSQGKNKPLLDQETGWARAVNRRVEFQVKAQ
jgi:outer membrane protein OmpA-like peptidoglycan-associated protein